MIKKQFRTQLFSATLGSLLLLIGASSAAESRVQDPSANQIKLAVHDTVLANGLKVLLLENHQSPLVACRLFYVTGSVHESPGHAGLAHMLEHMLFKGTKKVGIKDWKTDSLWQSKVDSVSTYYHQAEDRGDGTAKAKYRAQIDSLLTIQRQGIIKDELWQALQEQGGTDLNAFTTDLATAYFVTLPREKTELFLWLEADRMENAIFREFLPERDVVREERRMRTDDSPYGRYHETLDATFYESHPYRIPTIGWPSDIEHLSKAAIEEHYRKYYKPNNAILVLVGDFDSKQIMPKISQYFSAIPRGEAFPPLTVQEPKQIAAKSITQYKDGAKPRYDLMFHAPPVGTKEAYALEILSGALSGKSGRLYHRLVEGGLAVSVGSDFDARPYTSTFSIEAELKPEVDPKEVEKAIWQEIAKTQSELLSARELQKVKNQSFSSIVQGLNSMDNMANQLGFWELYGSWTWLRDYPARLDEVSPDQIRDASSKYLQYDLSTTGWLLPQNQRPQFANPGVKP